MVLLFARIEFHTLFKLSFVFRCFPNPVLWVTDVKLTATAKPVTEVSRRFFSGFNYPYLLCFAILPPSNKKHSSISLLSKHQILFWFLNIQRLFSLNILLLENGCIFEGIVLGASSFFQDTKMHIWVNLWCQIYRKQKKIFALYRNEPPHCLPWLPLHNLSINL